MLDEISVIICSYNPQEIYFKQCLQSIEDANKKHKVKEILIIDNNSVPALQEVAYIKNFAERTGNTRIIKKQKKGLRLRGWGAYKIALAACLFLLMTIIL